ncbi:hypothetical protein RCL1_003290 [Eukaryota sp. TZLM3-RCL]
MRVLFTLTLIHLLPTSNHDNVYSKCSLILSKFGCVSVAIRKIVLDHLIVRFDSIRVSSELSTKHTRFLQSQGLCIPFPINPHKFILTTSPSQLQTLSSSSFNTETPFIRINDGKWPTNLPNILSQIHEVELSCDDCCQLSTLLIPLFQLKSLTIANCFLEFLDISLLITLNFLSITTPFFSHLQVSILGIQNCLLLKSIVFSGNIILNSIPCSELFKLELNNPNKKVFDLLFDCCCLSLNTLFLTDCVVSTNLFSQLRNLKYLTMMTCTISDFDCSVLPCLKSLQLKWCTTNNCRLSFGPNSVLDEFVVIGTDFTTELCVFNGKIPVSTLLYSAKPVSNRNFVNKLLLDFQFLRCLHVDSKISKFPLNNNKKVNFNFLSELAISSSNLITVDLTRCFKLKKLIINDAVKLENIAIGEGSKLEFLNIKNCRQLKSLDFLKNCLGLKTLYFHVPPFFENLDQISKCCQMVFSKLSALNKVGIYYSVQNTNNSAEYFKRELSLLNLNVNCKIYSPFLSMFLVSSSQ